MNQKPKLQLELPFLETLPHTHGSTSSPDSLPSSSVKFSTTSQISSEKITSINSSRTTSLAVGDPPARTQRLSTLRLLVIHIGSVPHRQLTVSSSYPIVVHLHYFWLPLTRSVIPIVQKKLNIHIHLSSLDHRFNELADNCERDDRHTLPIYLGWGGVYAHTNSFPAALWEIFGYRRQKSMFFIELTIIEMNLSARRRLFSSRAY